MHDRQTCQGCGTRPDEWDPNQGGYLDAYTATEAEPCRGCREMERGHDKYERVTLTPRGV